MGRNGALSAFLFFTLAACTGGGSGSSSAPPLTLASPPAAGIAARGVITHVIVIVQENRTFDTIFGGYPGGPAPYGNGADSTIPNGAVAAGMHPTTFASDIPSNAHDWYRCLQVNLFDTGVWTDYANGTWPPGPQPCPTSAPPENPDALPTPPATPRPDPGLAVIDDLHRITYWSIANAYEIGDNFYAVQSSDSFAGHQYVVALQSTNDLNEVIDGTPSRDHDSSLMSCGTVVARNDVHTPVLDFSTGFTKWQYEGATGTCWGAPTFADRLDGARVDWRHYSTDYVTQNGSSIDGGVFDGFINYRQWFAKTKAIPGGRFRLARDVLQSDIAAHDIGAFAWVKPPCIALSDHPGATHDPVGGQSWVGSVVNWIGRDAQLWPHTVIFVVWDDWGGFYDHAVPLQSTLDGTHALTPGMRQPFLVISAYGKGRGYVSHAPGTYASVFKFVEDLYGVTPLNALDANAPDLADYFDFSKAPDAFRPATITESNFTPRGTCALFTDIKPYLVDR